MLGISNDTVFRKYGIVDSASGEIVMFQHFDKDFDGTFDVILFQPRIKANSEKTYIARPLKTMPEFVSKVYSRFVPERTDDYAWENDRVAFRTFGPKAQQMAEHNITGGTLTSGIDCWLKKVDYPIIDSWYEKHTSGKGSYHVDTGEGFDNFHVGTSRGCGGIGVWENDTLWTSKNFTKWQRLANGPIRTTFKLEYASWNVNGKSVEETQIISLDLGSNLTKTEVFLTATNSVTVGITLHEKTGEVSANPDLSWFSYWEPFPEEEYQMGMAVVLNPKYFVNDRKYISLLKDHSHLFIDMKTHDGSAVYYSGFTWTKSGQFANKKLWENYLTEFVVKMRNPLKLKYSKPQ